MNVEYEFKVNNITYMNFDMGFEEVSDTMPVVVCFPLSRTVCNQTNLIKFVKE